LEKSVRKNLRKWILSWKNLKGMKMSFVLGEKGLTLSFVLQKEFFKGNFTFLFSIFEKRKENLFTCYSEQLLTNNTEDKNY